MARIIYLSILAARLPLAATVVEGLPRDFVSSDQARRFSRRRWPPAETAGPFVVYSFQQQFPIAPFTSSFCVRCSVVRSYLRMFFARTLPINALCPPSLNIALYSPLPPSRTMISAGVVDRLPTRAVISYTTVLVSCFFSVVLPVLFSLKWHSTPDGLWL